MGRFGKRKFWYDYAGGDQTNGTNVEHKIIDAYDPLDRVLSVRRKFKNNGTWSGDFKTSQTYGLAGQVLTKTYPSLHTANYSYDTAGDLSSFSGNLGNGTSRTYSSNLSYNAQGQMLREHFGTSTVLYHNRHYNRRGQLYDVRLGTGSDQGTEWTWNRGALRSFYSSDYTDYDPSPSYANNNGNIYRQDHFVPENDSASSWSMAVDWYGYDSISRVTGIWEQTYRSSGNNNYATFNQQYSYDRFGNRLVSAANVPNVPNPSFKINGPKNRLIASTDVNGNEGSSDKMQYDAAGNMNKDTHTQGGAGTRTFDAENRMLTAVGTNGLQNTYTYDADGRRTRRSINNGGETWWQVFGIDGELVAEYQLVSGTPTLKKEYGYRSGQLLVIAEATSSNCQWLVTDALGTPRMIADQTGNLAAMKRRDYLPFGEEVYANAGHRLTTNGYATSQATTPRQQFTGKERDNETGLDYFEARYYGATYGRFISPDEFTGGPDELYDFAGVASDNPLIYAELVEPQSLNKYQYCYNNPLNFVDHDGHKGSWWETIKSGAEYVSWVPGPIGQGASALRAGMAIAEGDYKGALEHGIGALPGGKYAAKAVKVFNKATDAYQAVDRVNDTRKALTSTVKAVAPCALCFTAGTEISTPEGKVPIEQLKVGERVTTTGVDASKPDGWTAVDPATWRRLKLRALSLDDSGDVYEIELLRSLAWIKQAGAKVGGQIDMEITEIGLLGKAEVLEISACPDIKAGSGRIVLMTVTHFSSQIMELRFAGLQKPLEPTATHPFYSEDRNTWVPAGELQIGERIRTRDASVQLVGSKWRPYTQRVYNLEVEADHSYYVS